MFSLILLCVSVSLPLLCNSGSQLIILAAIDEKTEPKGVFPVETGLWQCNGILPENSAKIQSFHFELWNGIQFSVQYLHERKQSRKNMSFTC